MFPTKGYSSSSMKSNKINIDFDVIENCNPKYLTVADYSDWQHIEGKPAIIEITPPGSKKCVTAYFDKFRLNVFDSENLNLSCTEKDCEECELINLPDGIYTISIKGSPDTFCNTKEYLKIDNTRLELDKLIINTDKEDTQSWNKIQEIEMLLSCAEANIRFGNICDAQELLFSAQELIGSNKDCIGCV